MQESHDEQDVSPSTDESSSSYDSDDDDADGAGSLVGTAAPDGSNMSGGEGPTGMQEQGSSMDTTTKVLFGSMLPCLLLHACARLVSVIDVESLC